MTITSIREALRSLTQALQISSIFPATFFVWIHVYFLLPRIFEFEPTSLQAVSLTISASLMVSYLLYAFNFPLIRLLEGYKWQFIPIFSPQNTSQKARAQQLTDEIDELTREEWNLINELGYDPELDLDYEPRDFVKEGQLRDVRFRMAKAEQRRRASYPTENAAILPTRLGNVIAAWEEYSCTRYGMDGVALWPRLVPLLKKYDFLRFVDGEKTVFDFLLNLLLVTVILGVECFYFFLYFVEIHWALLVLLVTGIAAFGLYEALLVAARQWGSTVKVAYDLFRHDLHAQLGLKTRDYFTEDFKLWQEYSRHVIYADAAEPNKLFQASKDMQANHSRPLTSQESVPCAE